MAKSKKLADFRAKHDRSVIVPGRIKTALEAMAKDGPDAWEYEGDFIKKAGVSQTDIGAFRDQFEAHVVTVPGKNSKRVWVATAKEAKKFRETVGASGL